jgi:hypothetical protein
MARKQKKKKPRPLELAPIHIESEPLQLELSFLELLPLDPRELSEFLEIALKPFNIGRSEINQDGAAEYRDEKSRTLSRND